MKVYLVVLELYEQGSDVTREPLVVYSDMGDAENYCAAQQLQAGINESYVVWNMTLISKEGGT